MKIKTIKKKELATNFCIYYINDIEIVTTTKSQKYFCTVKNGKRSRIRDKIKNAYSVNWNYNRLIELLKDKKLIKNFKNDYPDLQWGYQGLILNKKKIEEIFSKYNL